MDHIVDNVKFVVRYKMFDLMKIAKDNVNSSLQESWGLLDKIFVSIPGPL